MKKESIISITAPARLHLGFMDLNGSLGRKFGSVGLAIDSIETSITARKNSSQSNQIINKYNQRACDYAKLILKAYEVDDTVLIDVHKKIPEHAGLGSGTQLALSVGVAISKLFDLNLSLMDIGKILDRGNTQIRNLESEFVNYEISKKKYFINLPVAKPTGDQDDRKE